VEDGGRKVGNQFVNRIHKSRGILICKILLLRKCKSGGELGQIDLDDDDDDDDLIASLYCPWSLSTAPGVF
jgi:hypothetical protein